VNYLVFLTLYEKTRLLGNWRPDHCGETNGLVSFFYWTAAMEKLDSGTE